MNKLDTIILAGGLGTRLTEIISDLPKVLAPVNDRPFLDVILSSLNRCGCVRRVVFAVGYLADRVIKEYAHRPEYNTGRYGRVKVNAGQRIVSFEEKTSEECGRICQRGYVSV